MCVVALFTALRLKVRLFGEPRELSYILGSKAVENINGAFLPLAGYRSVRSGWFCGRLNFDGRHG